MSTPVSQPLAYASPTTPSLRPTEHSWLAAVSLLVFISSVIFEKTLVALAHHGSRTYPWERFERNIGWPVSQFHEILWYIGLAGSVLALAALLHPFRKRWATWISLVLNLFTMLARPLYVHGDEMLIGVVGIALIIALIQLVFWYSSRKKPQYAIQVD